MQDKIANRAKDIAGLMVGREMSDSSANAFRPQMKEFVRACAENV